MRPKFNWLVAVFCFFLMLPAFARSSGSIEVEGVGPSRDQAIRSGLRSAVEQVVGVYLLSSTQVKNFVMQNDTITTKAAGFVRSYRTISCSRAGGLDKCRLVVDVEGDERKIALLLRELLGKRTFSIRVLQFIDGEQSQDQSIAQSLARELIASGYYVVRESFDPFYRIKGRAAAMETRSQLTDPSFKVVKLANMEITLRDKTGMTLAVFTTRDAEKCIGSGNTLEEAGLDLFECLSGDLGKKFVKAIKDKIRGEGR